jgi:DNA polymerase-3 subunit alpha
MGVERPFCHLHCHSHYSLLDGASRIPELVRRVKELGMSAVALTDHGNLYGAIELYHEAREVGIRPIVGYEAYVAPGKRTDREQKGMSEASYHLTLLARNRTGFQNLVKMASLAFLEGFYYRPRIDKELLASHSDGLICLSGCPSSEFATLILKNQLDEATKLAQWYAKVFGPENFFIELQDNGLDIQRTCSAGAIDIAQRLGIPTVVTNDAHYLRQNDASAHDVLLCINTGKLRSDENRMKYGSHEFYVKAPEEMYDRFGHSPDAVKRTQEIAERCELELDFTTRHFPHFEPPEGKTAEACLRELCEQGLHERYAPPAPAGVEAEEAASRLAAARKRLDHELAIINKLGFASYFLIVWDFVRFAREKGIPAGARGSACGALVSYLLYFSHVDPLEYDLLFERFLDPNRAEAPDIDIDFCQEGRDQVIAYVRQKYGEGSVAQIATFGTMAARAAVRDVGRVLGIELPRVDQVAKMIPQQLGITLEDALRQSSDLRREYDSDPLIRELIDIARTLEGTNRNVGTHAAGVVIASGPITDFVPVQKVLAKGAVEGKQADKETRRQGEAEGDEEAGMGRRAAAVSSITTQWTMEDIEKVGLLKMDFLGLRNLTMLDKAVKLIRETRRVDIDLLRLPPNDPQTYALLQRGDTQGVFQFESAGIRDLLQRMKPDSIRDLIAANALYRPGPLGGGMVDAYINRKHGREKPVYPHPAMEEILAETYGVMVYQEQVMRILNRLGGIELSSAYACIKAISKKKQEIIDQRQEEFIAGSKQRGATEELARGIFELIKQFGGYGFNKSHSTAYAQLAYQTAYLKAHYPAEFMAALLTSEISSTDKIAEHLENSRRLGLEVQPPDVNRSAADFTVDDGKVLFGLAAIKGLGRKAAEAIVTERGAGGDYKDLYNFCERLDQRIVTRAAVETLVKAGAFDAITPNRSALFAAIPSALQSGTVLQEDRRRGQANIFDMFDGESESAVKEQVARSLPLVPEWSDSERLSFEKEALGFYISSHPLARHAESIHRYGTHRVQDIAQLEANSEVLIGGMLTGVRFMSAKRSRSGNLKMARFKLEDMTGSAECVIFPDDYVRNKDEVRDENICFVKASVDRTREEPGLIITRILTPDQAQREYTRGLMLKLTSGVHAASHVLTIGRILQRTPGRCPVTLEVTDASGRRAWLRLGESYAVDPGKVAFDELETLLGPDHVKLQGANGNGNGQT